MSNNTAKTQTKEAAAQPANIKKTLIILGLVVAAFLLSYNFATAKSGQNSAPDGPATAGSAPSAAGGGGCCGGGGAPVEGSTEVAGDVQRIAVDTSAGSFNPNVIKAKAGVPIEIDFSQSPGGCLSGVMFPDFSINEDLTGGAKTVKLPALEPGTYTFYCQMQMVSGTLVVE
jgi:plastocyanin